MIEVHLMDIIWHGHSCFELVSGGYSAVIDPFQDTSVGTAYPHVRLTAAPNRRILPHRYSHTSRMMREAKEPYTRA